MSHSETLTPEQRMENILNTVPMMAEDMQLNQTDTAAVDGLPSSHQREETEMFFTLYPWWLRASRFNCMKQIFFFF